MVVPWSAVVYSASLTMVNNYGWAMVALVVMGTPCTFKGRILFRKQGVGAVQFVFVLVENVMIIEFLEFKHIFNYFLA